MAHVVAGQVQVGAEPVVVFDVGDESTTARSRLVLKNAGSTTVFLGGDDVSTTTGFALDPGETLRLEALQDAHDDFYAVAETTGSVHALTY